MGKLLKSLTASALTMSIFIATVVCCCVAPAVMAHMHKASVCGHCPSPSAGGQGHSNPAAACPYQLTDADTLPSGLSIFSTVTPAVFLPVAFLNNTPAGFSASPQFLYPRSPPLAVSFVPPYLRTFNLRI